MFAASGRITCDFGPFASAFLVYRNNIVVTARHVLYREPSHRPYTDYESALHRCGFEITDGKTSTWYDIDVDTIIRLPDNERSRKDRFDWAVMRLFKPIIGVTPYRLPIGPVRVGDAVTAVTIRQDGFPKQDWNERILADCKIQKTLEIDSISAAGEQIDCSSNGGASGGALLRPTADGYEAIGIISSTTTGSCPRFDPLRCETFAVGLTGPVIDAIKFLDSELP